MSYKIEQLGYEYRGYKLGQMTDRGMIIGFDTRFTDTYSFITVESNMSCRTVQDAAFVDVVLKGYENSKYEWCNSDEVKTLEVSQPNPLQLIRKAVNGHTVKLELFAEEFCISLYDSEIPICWNKDDGIHILTEVMNSNIYADMISEIGEVVKIIEDNLEWFDGCMNG